MDLSSFHYLPLPAAGCPMPMPDPTEWHHLRANYEGDPAVMDVALADVRGLRLTAFYVHKHWKPAIEQWHAGRPFDLGWTGAVAMLAFRHATTDATTLLHVVLLKKDPTDRHSRPSVLHRWSRTPVTRGMVVSAGTDRKVSYRLGLSDATVTAMDNAPQLLDLWCACAKGIWENTIHTLVPPEAGLDAFADVMYRPTTILKTLHDLAK